MNEFLADRYYLKIVIHPLDVIELIGRILGVITTIGLVYIVLLLPEVFFIQKITFFLLALFIFIVHLLRRKQNPHLFHPPHLHNFKAPLSESIRANWIYIISSSLYISYFVLNLLRLTHSIDELITSVNFIYFSYYIINYLAAIIFFTVLFFYLPIFVQVWRKHQKLHEMAKFFLNDILIIGPLLFIFFNIITSSSSFVTSLYLFGKILLGSISFMMLRDIILGKWTHSLQ